MSTISVITPVYDVEKYLNICIKCVMKQTFQDFELILINDGSTDNSGKICDEYALTDKRVKVIHQSNSGQSVARNCALSIAQGEYIAFVDSDDYIHPRMFEKLIENAEKTNATVSIGGYKNVFDHYDKEELIRSDVQTKLWSGKEFLTHCLINGVDKKPWVLWDKIFHRSCFENIRMPEGRIYEDNAIVYKILYEADKIVDCNAPFYYYFQNPDSTVNQKFQRKHLDWLLVPQEMIKYFTKKQDDILLDKANKMYLYALEDMYRKVHMELNDIDLEQRIKKELLEQYKKEKQRYSITIKTHPGLYEILHPIYSDCYWTVQGIINKVKRR